MFFTFFNNITNVWYNDAHKVSLFFNVFLLPLYILFFKFFFSSLVASFRILNNKTFSRIFVVFSIYLFVLLNFVFFILGGVGLFQIILPDFFDAAIRSLGLLAVFFSLNLYVRFFRRRPKKQNDNAFISLGFYEVIRHPEYFILFIFSLGISCSFISIFGLVLTLLQIPFTIIISLIEESEISKNDENYFDYKNETPMLIPEIRTLLKKIK
ncbi:MAG TPA: methyltransferase [Spirochaetota bacterium]|nr:methyltransferase [Spirochaetota bacterium]